MSQASYHEGLSIEPDESVPTLRIEGQLVEIYKENELFLYKKNNNEIIKDNALDQLAIKIINSWEEFLNQRKKIREVHLQKLNDAIKHGIEHWNKWRKDNPEIRPLLYKADLSKKHISSKDKPIDFSNANLIEAKLMRSYLEGANFHEANLGHANLSRAHLTGAHFCRTDLYKTILAGARLHHANLQGTQMAMTDLRGATLKGCKIYGISAWDLEMEEANQKGFRIIYKKKNEAGVLEESQIEVDDLRVAQFIYLMLHNSNIRYIIDTITSKAVLILGRFCNERKAVLDALRDALRKKEKLVPIIFDFEQPKNRDLTETVRLLADMAKFVIADITEAKSIPQELAEIIPFLPSVPIIPILLKNEEGYSLFPHWKRYHWVSPVIEYKDKDHLIANVERTILKSVEEMQNKKDIVLEQKRMIEEVKKYNLDLYIRLLKYKKFIVD